MVIDAHTHWYPDFIARNPCAWAVANGEEHWGRLMAPREDGKANLQGFPSLEKFLSDMDAANVGRAVIQGWYWQNQKNCADLNASIIDSIRPFFGRLSAFCAINPAQADIPNFLAEAKELGFIGIGELHDTVQGFSFASEKFAELCGVAARLEMPISIHLSDPDGKDYSNKIHTDNVSAYSAAKKFPHTKFIFSHWGGGEVFKEGFIPLDNVFYDTAANSLLYGSKAWGKISALLTDKIIYGSDYPLRLYPSRSKVEEMVGFFNEAAEFVPSENHKNFFSANFLSI